MHIHNITHNGVTQCLADWARQCGISHTAFSYWLHDHGIEIAIKMAGMDRQERQLFRAALRGNEPKTTPELEPFDPDLEFKNRIKCWEQLGMSKSEMMIKARMI